MSHHTRIKTELTDLAELKATLEDLGCDVRVGTLEADLVSGPRLHSETSLEITALPPAPGETKKRPAAHHLSRYEPSVLGFMKVGETFELVADRRRLNAQEQERLKDIVSKHYAYRTLKKKLKAQGFTVTREEDEGGELRLVLSRGNGELVEGTIGSEGKVSLQARGFKGKECLAATMSLETALGTVEERELTAEGYFGSLEPAAGRECDYAVLPRTPQKQNAATGRDLPSEDGE